jgi:3',5'-cyclic AMP phosphodiesterase CpdA
LTRFVLAHLSDPHLTPPPLPMTVGNVLSKRFLSRLSWARKRRFEHRPQVLNAIVADLLAHKPDHVAITGDLTNFAAPEEFLAARGWLQSLGSAQDVTVIPGNHDALIDLPPAQGLGQWADFLSDTPAELTFPTMRVRGAVAIIGVCSAIPTPPGSAAGRVGADQRDRLLTALTELGREGLFRIVLIHHPPADGLVKARKRLLDAAEFRAVIQAAGAELVLHGHGHEPAVSSLPGPAEPIPCLGAPSASAIAGGKHAAARWRRIEIEDPGGEARVTVVERGLGEDGTTVRELGAYRLAGPRPAPRRAPNE